MSFDLKALSENDREALLRWRLVLGPGCEGDSAGCCSLSGLGSCASNAAGVGPGELDALDGALSFVYEPDGSPGSCSSGGCRPGSGGSGGTVGAGSDSRESGGTGGGGTRDRNNAETDHAKSGEGSDEERDGATSGEGNKTGTSGGKRNGISGPSRKNKNGEGDDDTNQQREDGAEGSRRTRKRGRGNARQAAADESAELVDEPTRRTQSGGANLGGSHSYLPDWLSAVREFFGPESAALLRRDALDRKGILSALLEPEALPHLVKDVELLTAIARAHANVPPEAKEKVREVVRDVVDELRKKLETIVHTSIMGALRRDRHGPLKLLKNVDWKRTIRSNLKGWDRDRKRLVPDRIHFWANQRRRFEWDVVLLVDQSASMAESVVHAAVMAAIFASLDVLRTRLVLFDTAVVDATAQVADPVEVLLSAQLGGGTDIAQAVAYAQAKCIERPDRTLLVIVSDLCEGGSKTELLARLRELVESRVRVLSVLAISEAGRPAYDHDLATRVEALGIPCFASTPRDVVDTVARLVGGEEPTSVARGAR